MLLQWDLVEKQPVPVSAVLGGSAILISAVGVFGKKWWTKRHSKLITQFVDDMVSGSTQPASAL